MVKINLNWWAYTVKDKNKLGRLSSKEILEPPYKVDYKDKPGSWNQR